MSRILTALAAVIALGIVAVPIAAAQQVGPIVEQGRGGRYGNWLFVQGAPGTGAGVTTFNSKGTVTVSASTSTLVLATYVNRRGGQIQNQATTTVYCSDNVNVSSTNGAYAFALRAASNAADGSGGVASLSPPYIGPIYCISTASSTVSFSDF